MTSEELTPEKEVKKTYKKVRIVTSRGKSAIVEWVEHEKACRKIVPVEEIDNGKIESEVLKKSPDYGVPWAKEISLSATSEDLETALHNAGIWTAEDAFKNPGGIIGALNAAYKTSMAAVLRAAKKYKNKE